MKHYSDEEHERMLNDPDVETAEQRHQYVTENYPKEELVDIGYIDSDGNIVEARLLDVVPRRDYFREMGSVERWQRQKAHLISRKARKEASSQASDKDAGAASSATSNRVGGKGCSLGESDSYTRVSQMLKEATARGMIEVKRQRDILIARGLLDPVEEEELLEPLEQPDSVVTRIIPIPKDARPFRLPRRRGVQSESKQDSSLLEAAEGKESA